LSDNDLWNKMGAADTEYLRKAVRDVSEARGIWSHQPEEKGAISELFSGSLPSLTSHQQTNQTPMACCSSQTMSSLCVSWHWRPTLFTVKIRAALVGSRMFEARKNCRQISLAVRLSSYWLFDDAGAPGGYDRRLEKYVCTYDGDPSCLSENYPLWCPTTPFDQSEIICNDVDNAMQAFSSEKQQRRLLFHRSILSAVFLTYVYAWRYLYWHSKDNDTHCWANNFCVEISWMSCPSYPGTKMPSGVSA
jgi:hypothetical protein